MQVVQPVVAKSSAVRAAGTPIIGFFKPDEMMTLVRDAGFKPVARVSPGDLTARYCAGRADGLEPDPGAALPIANR